MACHVQRLELLVEDGIGPQAALMSCVHCDSNDSGLWPAHPDPDLAFVARHVFSIMA